MTEDPSKPTVALSDRQDVPVEAGPLEDLAARALVAEGVGPSELSISLVDEEEMAGLRERYAGEAGATDVLAFPQDGEGPPGERRLLGDVVICPAVAARQGGDLPTELRLLVVHGVLHLLGYDHQEEAARRAMWERQEAYSGVRVP